MYKIRNPGYCRSIVARYSALGQSKEQIYIYQTLCNHNPAVILMLDNA